MDGPITANVMQSAPDLGVQQRAAASGQPKRRELPHKALRRALETARVPLKRVQKWWGERCGCAERQARVNAAYAWAARYLDGNATVKNLEDLIGA